MEFPYGKAPLCILILALIAGTAFAISQIGRRNEKATLIYATASQTHYNSYIKMLPKFEAENPGVRIDLQLVAYQALQSRMNAALQSGAPVPDLAEVWNLGYFLKGPLENVQLVDLTDRIKQDHLDEQMVATRFSMWSSRGRIFGLPHDLHPVVLVYRRDILEKEGIDPKSIQTWDDFVRVAHQLGQDKDGDGKPDRYALDVPTAGENQTLSLLVFQRGGQLINERGEVAFDTEQIADIICWYVENLEGRDPIFYSLVQSRGGGRSQSLTKAVEDGFIVFLLAADWRTKHIQNDFGRVSGLMEAMPLPAWEPGGCRTSTAGGTCLVITRQCKNVDLAWKLAKFLYTSPDGLEERYKETNIIPPVKALWKLPIFDKPNPFYSNQHMGQLFTTLGPTVPPVYSSPYFPQATNKLSSALVSALLYYDANGSKGLKPFVMEELHRQANELRTVIAHNHFYSQ